MIVKALDDIGADEEVYISYGSAATQPAWKCLFSYGFVPEYRDQDGISVFEDDVAEITLEDGRITEVGPTEIPFDLVAYEAERLGQLSPNGEVEFTKEIGECIVAKVESAAKELVDFESHATTTSEEAVRLAATLRNSNVRTLRACAGGLRDFIQEAE